MFCFIYWVFFFNMMSRLLLHKKINICSCFLWEGLELVWILLEKQGQGTVILLVLPFWICDSHSQLDFCRNESTAFVPPSYAHVLGSRTFSLWCHVPLQLELDLHFRRSQLSLSPFGPVGSPAHFVFELERMYVSNLEKWHLLLALQSPFFKKAFIYWRNYRLENVRFWTRWVGGFKELWEKNISKLCFYWFFSSVPCYLSHMWQLQLEETQ